MVAERALLQDSANEVQGLMSNLVQLMQNRKDEGKGELTAEEKAGDQAASCVSCLRASKPALGVGWRVLACVCVAALAFR